MLVAEQRTVLMSPLKLSPRRLPALGATGDDAPDSLSVPTLQSYCTAFVLRPDNYSSVLPAAPPARPPLVTNPGTRVTVTSLQSTRRCVVDR